MEFELTRTRPALLVIDLQELFTSAEGPFKNTDARATIEAVNQLIGACETRGLPIIYSRYLFQDDLSDAGLLLNNPLVQEGYFCESSEWMQLDHNLKLADSAIHLHRNRPGAFWNGKLESRLAELGTDTLLLCGLSVNNAISTTAREAFARDFPCLVVRNCTGAAPFEKDLDSYFETLHTWTAEVCSSDEILKRLDN